MAKFLKLMLSAFMIAGIAIALYGGWEILNKMNIPWVISRSSPKRRPWSA